MFHIPITLGDEKFKSTNLPERNSHLRRLVVLPQLAQLCRAQRVEVPGIFRRQLHADKILYIYTVVEHRLYYAQSIHWGVFAMDTKFDIDAHLNNLAADLVENFARAGRATTPGLVGSARESEVRSKVLIFPFALGISFNLAGVN